VITGLLFIIAFAGGALNAVAGGGSFLTLPTLLYAGIPPIAANATSTFAMWPASLASAVAYRREIVRARPWMLTLGTVSLAGGLFGGLLLVRTSNESFIHLLPWLMLIAAATFSWGSRVAAWVSVGREPGPRRVPFWTLAIQLVIATYGGYFGGGMGIMMLAALSIAGMQDMHEMNGLKTMLAIAINGVALAAFVISGAISWVPGTVMAVGGVIGGYAGAALARRVAGPTVRAIVIVVAWGMTIYFFLR
jgi:uncharacterized membrane protein YfcA